MNKIIFILLIVFSHISMSGSLYKNDIPDFTQTNIVGKNSGNGQQYCAPVAVSNSIAWLSNKKTQQVKLINKLASKQYMNTSLNNGTGTAGVLRGVDKIANELFKNYSYLKYEGWRVHPKKYSTGVKIPNIIKMKNFPTKKSAAWINVGWYKYNQSKNEYRRIGGHWVTLVGSNSNQLVIHDPSPRAGKAFANEYISYSKLTSGNLVGKKQGLPVSAYGYVSLGRGMHIKSKADFAIIDGVVYFKL